MRKRIIIGLLAVVVIGVLAYVISQPKRGTVEWHKREYLRASKEGWRTRAQNLWNRARGKAEVIHLPPVVAFDERLAKHQGELIRLGYLEQRELVFSNRTVEAILFGSDFETMRTNLLKDTRFGQLEWDFVDLTPTTGEFSIRIVAPPQNMPVLEETLRRADVPETGK